MRVPINETVDAAGGAPAQVHVNVEVNVYDHRHDCELNDTWGVMIQVSMLLLAMLAMVIKRSLAEQPRPLLIWYFDTSKQGFASCINHMANILLSEYLGVAASKASQKSDKCSWYFVTFIMDCVIGTYLLIFLTEWFAQFVERRKLTSYVSGEYGNPPQWSAYGKQLGVFTGLTILSKTLVAGVTMLPVMNHVGRLVWGLLEIISFNNDRVKALMSLFVVPTALNILIFIIIDNVIKKRGSSAGSS